ncbi:MAG TPA: hypothetical protein V6D18_20215 [Thermosynechococcaceae cyanobacterium]
MKRITIALVTFGTIVTGSTTLMQRAVAQPVVSQGAALLQTQPVSIGSPTTASESRPYARETLNGVSNSIQVPQSPSRIVLPTFVPRNLDLSPAPVSSGPLDFFRIQAPDRGVRFRVGESP